MLQAELSHTGCRATWERRIGTQWHLWGSPNLKASHIKANHPHFPRFRVRIFCIFRVFRVFAPWGLFRPLFLWGDRGFPHFPHFPRIGFESLISKIRPTGFIVPQVTGNLTTPGLKPGILSAMWNLDGPAIRNASIRANRFAEKPLLLREAKPGGFQTRVFPTFFGKGPDCVADPFGTVPRRCSQ